MNTKICLVDEKDVAEHSRAGTRSRAYRIVDMTKEDTVFLDKFLKDENCVITEERPLNSSEISFGIYGNQSLFIIHKESQVFSTKIELRDAENRSKKYIMCQRQEPERSIVRSENRYDSSEDMCSCSTEGKEHLLWVSNVWLYEDLLLQKLHLPKDLTMNDTFKDILKFDGAICHECIKKKDFPHMIMFAKNGNVKVDAEIHMMNTGEIRTYGAKPIIDEYKAEYGDWLRFYFNPKYYGYVVVEIVKKEDIEKNGTIKRQWNSKLKDVFERDKKLKGKSDVRVTKEDIKDFDDSVVKDKLDKKVEELKEIEQRIKDIERSLYKKVERVRKEKGYRVIIPVITTEDRAREICAKLKKIDIDAEVQEIIIRKRKRK